MLVADAARTAGADLSERGGGERVGGDPQLNTILEAVWDVRCVYSVACQVEAPELLNVG